jgi:hypothetical protein
MDYPDHVVDQILERVRDQERANSKKNMIHRAGETKTRLFLRYARHFVLVIPSLLYIYNSVTEFQIQYNLDMNPLSQTYCSSHKRLTAQHIAGRLHGSLREQYSIFLDSEAAFEVGLNCVYKN